MAGSDVTVEILKDIRDEIRNTNRRLDLNNERLGAVESKLGTVESVLNHRLGVVESTLLDLAEQQRFVVRYTKAISERDSRIDLRVSVLELRLDKLESP